jgi:hypothetical protein
MFQLWGRANFSATAQLVPLLEVHGQLRVHCLTCKDFSSGPLRDSVVSIRKRCARLCVAQAELLSVLVLCVTACASSKPKAHPPSKKAKLDAAMEEGEHAARMYELQRSPHRQKPGSLPLLTDTELLEAMPTTMDWAMHRVLRDREDAELKEKAKQQESEAKATQPEGKDEEPGVGDVPRPAKRARMEPPVQNGEGDGTSSDNSDDGDPKKADKTTQEHKETRTGSQLEEGTPAVNRTTGARGSAPK